MSTSEAGARPAAVSPNPRRVLVTGAGGVIGKLVAEDLLRRGHTVRGFDRTPMPYLADAVEGDLVDRAAVDRATVGMETVIHLAAYPNDADFMKVLLEPNIIGVHHIFESARLAGVTRMIAVSTSQVISALQLNSAEYPDEVMHPDGPVGPMNYYACGKLFLEAVGQMYHYTHGMDVMIVRPGWLLRTPREVGSIGVSKRAQTWYLSYRDAQRFFACAVDAPPVGFARYFACSGVRDHVAFDLDPARRQIGYEPEEYFPAGIPESWLTS